MNKQIAVGSILRRRKGLIWHYGVQLKNNLVIHFTPCKQEQVVKFDEFADKKKVEVVETNTDTVSLERRVDYILSNQSNYNLFFNNCEHLMNYLIHGVRKSEQVSTVLATTLTVTVIGSANNKTGKGLLLGAFFGLALNAITH